MSEPLIVNKGELARMLAISQATIDRLLVEGCPVHRGGSNGVPYEFDFYAVKAWRDAREAKRSQDEEERQQRISQAQSELFADQKLAPDGNVAAAKEFLEAERIAIFVSRQKGELIEREDVRNDYAAVFGIVRQHALGWAATLGRVAGLTAEQQKEADRLVRAMLITMHGQVKEADLRPPPEALGDDAA